MKRQTVIDLIGVAGYHNDKSRYTRLLIENRISLANAQKAYSDGIKAKEAGVKCACYDCNK